jgi:hypothetical protein
MLPRLGFSDQRTAVFPLPDTVALNCWLWAAVNVTVAGDTTMVIAERAAIAVADLFGSATLVAVTVTRCGKETVEGAVYRPEFEILPRFGLRVQFTVVLVLPVTVAVNC